MENALIGYSGFVGGTLFKQAKFTALYRSTNIQEIRDKTFDTVVCAGAPAQKWIANKEPEKDNRAIDGLIDNLHQMKCSRIILISTVDVFKSPDRVTEETPIDLDKLHPYGTNRRRLEEFIADNFENFLIVRLPGLVGPGLKKNIIFDFLNSNNLQMIESRASYQFYPMVNLWWDIQAALQAGLSLVHLTAEPITVSEVASEGFGCEFYNHLEGEPACYDMRTRHGAIFGAGAKYQYSKKETLTAIRAYAQSEKISLPQENN